MLRIARYRIGVVGFGVAGATAAWLLARDGHEVVLFERAPKVGPVGAGILLQASGQMVLEKIGLLDEVVRQAEPVDELFALTHRGRQLIRLPYGALEPGCRAYGLHRGDLFGVLHARVTAQNVPIRLGHEICGTRGEGRQVYARDVHGREHGPFDFLIAADGSRSSLRASSRLRPWIHDYAYGALWLIGRSAAVRGRLHQVVQGTKHLLGLLPMGAGRCSLFWSLRRDEKDSLWQGGFAAWRDRVLRLCPLAEELFDGVTGFDQTAFTTYLHVGMRCWHDARVIFLGDAAHAMSPHLGQGVNLALIDAYRFVDCLARSEDHRQAFREYEKLRRPQIRYFALVTLLLTPFFQSNGFIKGLGRDLALPLMTRIPWIRRQMLLTMAGLKDGIRRKMRL